MGFNQLDRPTFERYRLVKEDNPVASQNATTSADGAGGSKDTAYALKSDLGAIWSGIDAIKERLKAQGEKKPMKARKVEEAADDE